MFLNSSNFQGENQEAIRLKQLEIATKWDRIEYALQKDDMWYFIGESDMPTRIDFIFDLIAENEKKNNKDEYATFRYFLGELKKKQEK